MTLEDDHHHCKVCGRVCESDREVCSKACREKRERAVQNRRMYTYLLYGFIVLTVALLLLTGRL
ncbi:MAG: DUF2116 family Zn-ribbon domain-containing protein [Thermoplasmata archaeon]